MRGLGPFRSLHSVMIVTLHVAVISYALRSFSRPSSLAGSFAVEVPVAILLALFLSVPIGHGIAAAFRPPEGMAGRRCRACGSRDLRPLLRAGGGLFLPAAGYRCAGCRTTYRLVGDEVVEEPATVPGAATDPEGIRFVADEPAGPEIRFLDEAPAGSANIPTGPVSGG